MLSKEFIEEMKNKLLAEKDRLTVDSSAMHEHTELGSDYDENAQEVELDELNQDLKARIESYLLKIEKALSKIELGTYGTDDKGQEIPEERLRVIPWADEVI